MKKTQKITTISKLTSIRGTIDRIVFMKLLLGVSDLTYVYLKPSSQIIFKINWLKYNNLN